jgi:hypothetical protein
MTGLRELQREINRRDHVVECLRRGGLSAKAAWEYYGAHQDKLQAMDRKTLNEWLRRRVEKPWTR